MMRVPPPCMDVRIGTFLSARVSLTTHKDTPHKSSRQPEVMVRLIKSRSRLKLNVVTV